MAMLQLLGLSAAAAATAPPAIVVVDVAAEFGIDYAGVQAAMGKARSVLKALAAAPPFSSQRGRTTSRWPATYST